MRRINSALLAAICLFAIGGCSKEKTALVGPAGGTVELGDVTLSVPPGSVLKDVTFSVQPARDDLPIPSGYVPAGASVEIKVSDQDRIDAPLLVGIRMDRSKITDAGKLAVLHYPDGGSPTLATIVRKEGDVVTFQTRSFSAFSLVERTESLPDAYSIRRGQEPFRSDKNGWAIDNDFRNWTLSPQGACIGMSVLAAWHFSNGRELISAFPVENVARYLALRAQVAANTIQRTTLESVKKGSMLSGEERLNQLKQLLLSDQPAIVLMYTDDERAGHAVLLYGYRGNELHIYDPNHPKQEKALRYAADSGGIASYKSLVNVYTKFHFLAPEDFGTALDLKSLVGEAERGFQGDQAIKLNEVKQELHYVQVEGQVDAGTLGSTSKDVEVLLFTKAGKQRVKTDEEGGFTAVVPTFNGDNVLTFIAGKDLSASSSYYKGSKSLLKVVTSTTPKTDLMVMLTWDNPGDLDLYGLEPPPSTEAAWFDMEATERKLILDADNEKGFGPEIISISKQDGATVLSGEYRLRVHFFEGASDPELDGILGLNSDVLIVLDENPQSVCRITAYHDVANGDKMDALPTSNSQAWRDIARVDVLGKRILGAECTKF